MPPLVLVILDGFGLAPTDQGNAIFSVLTPNFDQLLSYFPHTSLHASSEEVGLSWGEIGNSEVGHLNLGTGRIIMQDLPRIDKTIQDGTFFANRELLEAYKYVATRGTNLHLVGLVSAGGVHSHLNHLLALLDLAAKMQIKKVYVHFITDGRDTPAKVALEDLKTLENKFLELERGQVATVMGRYFAMDRDKHWDRVEPAYEAMFNPSFPKYAKTASEAIKKAYAIGKTDEFIEPVVISNTPRISDGDSIIFFNYRRDRVKQISEAIINPDFNGFSRAKILENFYFVSFTSYGNEPSPNVKIAFFAGKVTNQLAKIIADNKLSQLRVAETEKYPHITYFFNAGVDVPFPAEERILVQSPKVATYDLKPEMSADEVTQKFIENFQNKKPQFSLINFANPDMVGHTGIMEATKNAIITIDRNLGNLSNTVLSLGANLIVTADHGNAEQMVNPQTGEVDKEHTTNPVPVILALQEDRFTRSIPIDINYKINFAAKKPSGVLADVTVTCLDVLGLAKPEEMTGQGLRKII